jgi:hypothetical protein
VSAPVGAKGALDLAGLGERDGERLLAVDVLAGGEGGEQVVTVEEVGAGDVHDVDVGAFGDGTEVVGGPLEAEALLGRPGRFPAGGANGRQDGGERRRVVEEGHGQVRVGVHLADEAEAHEARPHRAPSRPTLIGWAPRWAPGRPQCLPHQPSPLPQSLRYHAS